jgi:hypothetical protein
VVLTVILAKALEYANKVLQGLAVHILAASELGATAARAMSVVIIALVCFAYEYLKQARARSAWQR